MKITLKAARINAGLTQKDASKVIGVSPQTLSSWEKGTTYPSVIDMENMRKVYNIDNSVDIEWRIKKRKKIENNIIV